MTESFEKNQGIIKIGDISYAILRQEKDEAGEFVLLKNIATGEILPLAIERFEKLFTKKSDPTKESGESPIIKNKSENIPAVNQVTQTETPGQESGSSFHTTKETPEDIHPIRSALFDQISPETLVTLKETIPDFNLEQLETWRTNKKEAFRKKIAGGEYHGNTSSQENFSSFKEYKEHKQQYEQEVLTPLIPKLIRDRLIPRNPESNYRPDIQNALHTIFETSGELPDLQKTLDVIVANTDQKYAENFKPEIWSLLSYAKKIEILKNTPFAQFHSDDFTSFLDDLQDFVALEKDSAVEYEKLLDKIAEYIYNKNHDLEAIPFLNKIESSLLHSKTNPKVTPLPTQQEKIQPNNTRIHKKNISLSSSEKEYLVYRGNHITQKDRPELFNKLTKYITYRNHFSIEPTDTLFIEDIFYTKPRDKEAKEDVLIEIRNESQGWLTKISHQKFESFSFHQKTYSVGLEKITTHEDLSPTCIETINIIANKKGYTAHDWILKDVVMKGDTPCFLFMSSILHVHYPISQVFFKKVLLSQEANQATQKFRENPTIQTLETMQIMRLLTPPNTLSSRQQEPKQSIVSDASTQKEPAEEKNTPPDNHSRDPRIAFLLQKPKSGDSLGR